MTTLTQALSTLSIQAPSMWRDPKASIADLKAWWSPVTGKKCWPVQGPALEAYEKIREKVEQHVKDEEQFANESREVTFTSASVNCYMIGKKASKAKPYVLICCNDEKFCLDVIRYFRARTWYQTFERDHEGFGGFLAVEYPPRKLAFTTPHSPTVWVYTSDQVSGIAGAPIFFSTELLNTDDPCQVPKAVLGGIVYLSGIPFGLTAAHPFTTREEHPGLDVSSTARPKVFYMDSIDDDSSSSSDSGSDSTADSNPNAVSEKSHEQLIPSQFLSGAPKRLGKIFCCSESTPGDATDWALIALSAGCIEALLDFQKAVKDGVGTAADVISHLKVVTNKIEVPRNVFLSGWNNSSDEGMLTASKSLVLLPGSREYLSLPTLVLRRDVRVGECGEWVVDFEGNWYGQVIAGNPGTPIAYIAPASEVVAAITKSIICAVTLGPDPLKIKYFATTAFAGETSPYGDQVFYSRAFLMAAGVGDADVLRLLVGEGLGVNYQDDDGRTAMEVAAHNGHKEAIQVLIDRGAEVDEKALNSAISHGNADVVNLLLDYMMNERTREPTLETDMKLLSILDEAKGNEQNESLRLDALIRETSKKYPLHTAAFEGNDKTVLKLLNSGLHVNTRDRSKKTALHMASECGHDRLVNLLIDKGADVNAKDDLDTTALHLASMSGHDRVVRILLDRGADVTACDFSSGTALQAAVPLNHEKVVESLAAYGSDVDIRDFSKATPLHMASSRGYEGIVKILRDYGAGIDAQDGLGRTALYRAASSGHKSVVQLLLDLGADTQIPDSTLRFASEAARSEGHEDIADLISSAKFRASMEKPLGSNVVAPLSGKSSLPKTALDVPRLRGNSARSSTMPTRRRISPEGSSGVDPKLGPDQQGDLDKLVEELDEESDVLPLSWRSSDHQRE